jgi:hypothetical protein
LAFHARPSHGPARARARRRMQSGITIKLADQHELTAVFAAKPCGLAGAVAAGGSLPLNRLTYESSSENKELRGSNQFEGHVISRALNPPCELVNAILAPPFVKVMGPQLLGRIHRMRSFRSVSRPWR